MHLFATVIAYRQLDRMLVYRHNAKKSVVGNLYKDNQRNRLDVHVTALYFRATRIFVVVWAFVLSSDVVRM